MILKVYRFLKGTNFLARVSLIIRQAALFSGHTHSHRPTSPKATHFGKNRSCYNWGQLVHDHVHQLPRPGLPASFHGCLGRSKLVWDIPQLPRLCPLASPHGCLDKQEQVCGFLLPPRLGPQALLWVCQGPRKSVHPNHKWWSHTKVTSPSSGRL